MIVVRYEGACCLSRTNTPEAPIALSRVSVPNCNSTYARIKAEKRRSRGWESRKVDRRRVWNSQHMSSPRNSDLCNIAVDTDPQLSTNCVALLRSAVTCEERRDFSPQVFPRIDFVAICRSTKWSGFLRSRLEDEVLWFLTCSQS